MSEELRETKVVQCPEGWTVEISIGAQSFHLGLTQPRTQEQAEWYKKQFDSALNSLLTSKLEEKDRQMNKMLSEQLKADEQSCDDEQKLLDEIQSLQSRVEEQRDLLIGIRDSINSENSDRLNDALDDLEKFLNPQT